MLIEGPGAQKVGIGVGLKLVGSERWHSRCTTKGHAPPANSRGLSRRKRRGRGCLAEGSNKTRHEVPVALVSGGAGGGGGGAAPQSRALQKQAKRGVGRPRYVGRLREGARREKRGWGGQKIGGGNGRLQCLPALFRLRSLSCVWFSEQATPAASLSPTGAPPLPAPSLPPGCAQWRPAPGPTAGGRRGSAASRLAGLPAQGGGGGGGGTPGGAGRGPRRGASTRCVYKRIATSKQAAVVAVVMTAGAAAGDRVAAPSAAQRTC